MRTRPRPRRPAPRSAWSAGRLRSWLQRGGSAARPPRPPVDAGGRPKSERAATFGGCAAPDVAPTLWRTMAASGAMQIDVQGWERSLLTAGVLGDVAGHARSLRDWIVDLVLFAFAGGVGLLFLAQTWTEHSTATLLFDVLAGGVACVSLWWRRDRPLTVALIVIPISAFSALAGGAAL